MAKITIDGEEVMAEDIILPESLLKMIAEIIDNNTK